MIVGISEISIIIDYLVAILIAIFVAFLLKVPLLPDKPYLYSFKASVLFPTPIFALGLFSFSLLLELYNFISDIYLAIIVGIFSGFFIKYIFNLVFPPPPTSNELEDV